VLCHLACFFKNPMGVAEHDFFKQFALLEAYAQEAAQSSAPLPSGERGRG
jgi:hypothetical protein